ncbi:hypothetical protein BpHYR1_039955 [Brachionus plicatilis]|uniref:Uncharacterized protein n=1 Tax=Brachionus plicatilis TaxID=10195 RepID=A0A3M7PAW2_BRAPC|nr:hypothetical protein BpHYR1_039955 [Brachionus plicatilis]
MKLLANTCLVTQHSHLTYSLPPPLPCTSTTCYHDQIRYEISQFVSHQNKTTKKEKIFARHREL